LLPAASRNAKRKQATVSMTEPGPVFRGHNITVRFGGLTAVDKVGVDVYAGEVTGLVGPNGAGKSTLFAALSGLIRPQEGTVWMNGAEITRLSAQQRARRGLARTFQHPEMFTGLTVRENLTIAYRSRFARRRLWTDLVTGGGLRRAPRAETEAIDRLAALVGLEPLLHRLPLGLPLGSCRLVELARSLATEPTVLLLDEPFSGLDGGETEQLVASLRRVIAEQHVGVLLVEHDVELVLGLSRRVSVLDFGQLIAEGTPAEIRQDPAVRAAYLGEEPAPAGRGGN
jgi:ABC-type branched-subunit amino acid transport system ATPase component